MELVLPMYNAHPYFSLKNVGKNVCIIHCKIRLIGVILIRSHWTAIVVLAVVFCLFVCLAKGKEASTSD